MGVRGVRGLWNCVAMEQSGYIREWQNLLLTLPDYTWEDIYKFSDEDIKCFQEIIESTAPLILEFSQEGGLENVSGF